MKSLHTQVKRIAQSATVAATAAYTSVAMAIGDVPSIGGGPDNLAQGIIDLLTEILKFLGIIAVVVIVIAGIRLIIGGADEGQREKARNAVLYAVIGLILVFLASAIVNFVGGLFGA